MFKEEYEKEIELIDSIRSSANIDGLPRQKFINRDTESRAIRLTEKLERMQNAIIEAFEIRQKVFDIVSEIPDVYGIVLSKRYIQEKQWCDIAKEMNFSEEYLHGSLHKKALKMMQDALDKRSWHHAMYGYGMDTDPISDIFTIILGKEKTLETLKFQGF